MIEFVLLLIAVALVVVLVRGMRTSMRGDTQWSAAHWGKEALPAWLTAVTAEVDWKSLRTAYGDASLVPAILADLFHDNAERREAALDDGLYSAVLHQGTSYSSTAPTVACLLRLIADRPNHAAVLLDFIAACATSQPDPISQLVRRHPSALLSLSRTSAVASDLLRSAFTRLPTFQAAFDALTASYERERVPGCAALAEDGDMLLFQWSATEIDITRQLIWSEDGEQGIWQFSIVAQAPNSGSGNRWCGTPQDLADFRAFVLASDAFRQHAHAESALQARLDRAE